MNNSIQRDALFLLTFAALGLFTLNGCSAQEDRAEEAADEMGKEVVYGKVNGKKVKGYFVMPESADEGKAPAIILIHEWWGLNDDMRAKARSYAKQGYFALAVDLYGGESTTKPQEARNLAGAVRQDMKGAFDNLKAAVKFLGSNKDVDTERVAAIGWCFGGGWSYQMAKNDLGVKASVIYYGRFNPRDDLAKMRASILGHFAEKDRAIRVDDVKEFQATLKTQSGNHEIYIYPNTQHGFASRPGNNPVYDKKAAEKANKRTLDFLTKALEIKKE